MRYPPAVLAVLRGSVLQLEPDDQPAPAGLFPPALDCQLGLLLELPALEPEVQPALGLGTAWDPDDQLELVRGCPWLEDQLEPEPGCPWPEDQLDPDPGCPWPEDQLEPDPGCPWLEPEDQLEPDPGCPWLESDDQELEDLPESDPEPPEDHLEAPPEGFLESEPELEPEDQEEDEEDTVRATKVSPRRRQTVHLEIYDKYLPLIQNSS